MAWGFTNVTRNENASLDMIDLKLKTNYAVVETASGYCRLDNKTAPIDQSENITLRFNNINNVGNSLVNHHPSNVKGGIQYLVKVDALNRTENATTHDIVDEPVTVQITVRHGVSSNIDADKVKTLLSRAVSALFKSDGTLRITDMMRGGVDIDAD
jgi:hypothetical protein